jgi:hypothetical protein
MKVHRRLLTALFCMALVPSAALIATAQYDDQGTAQYDQEADVSGPPPAADVQGPSDNQPDPPARAARLQYMSGSVSVQPHGTDDWVAGILNRPLTNSDNIWADKNSRAEISVGTGLIRIGSESSLTLTNISDSSVQLQLHQGAMNLHVRRLYDGETYEVDTPNQAFTVSKPGDYRFDVDSDADKTVITVWRGEGESNGSGPAVRIREGQQARFANGNSTEAADLHSAPSPDDFDQWASSRDERLDHSASARYVSPDVVGSEDLDEYGTWRKTSQYGSVWVPSGVGVGWAPYRNGHWIWVAPWGWTWVEDEPWGYAPFHYGRWVYYNNYWGWAPGPIYARSYYAPALVAWFGGPGWGVSVGFGGGYGGYGWCPLGYGEPYIPSYRVSRGYFNRVNITNTHITNVTNITNIYNNTYVNHHPGTGTPGTPGQPGHGGYPPTGGGGGLYGPHNNIRYANMRAPNGFTAVSRQTLVSSQSVARNAMRVSPNELSRMTPVHTLDVKPNRATMLGPNAGMRSAAPPPRTFARPVVSRAAMTSTVHARAGANTGFGIGSSRPMNTQRSAGPMNNGAIQRPAANNVGMQRPMNTPNRDAGQATANSNIRMPQRGAMSPNGGNGGAWSRSVPRPPSAGSFGGGGMNRGSVQSEAAQAPRSNISRPTMGADATRSQVPRPSPSYQANNRGYGNGSYTRPAPNSGSYGRPVPGNQGSYQRQSPSYSRPQANYGGGGYSRPSPSYGGAGSYGRPAPSMDRGGYSRPAPSYNSGSMGRSMPSYGGGGRSIPSAGRAAGGFGGGGGRSMPSYGGGRQSGGFGGGGGHASAPRGGGGSGERSGGGHGR